MVLQRYVLREHLAPFLLSFSAIVFLLVMDLVLQTADLILGKGVPAGVAAELFLLNTAWMVALAVPMAVLVGSLMAFGRLAGDNEITAMRAAGVGFHQLLWPALLGGATLGAGLVMFNDRVLPEFNHRARLLATDIQRKRPAAALDDRVGVFIEDFQDHHVMIGGIDPATGALRDVLIYKHEPSDYPITIAARRGELRYDPSRDEATLLLEDGEINRVDDSERRVFVTSAFSRQVVRLGDAGHRLSRSVSGYRNDREMSLSTMRERIRDYQADADSLTAVASQRFGAFLAKATLGLRPEETPSSGRPAGIGRPEDLLVEVARLSADATLIAHKRRLADRLRVEVHKKYSIPAACLVFVLVGAPLGVRVRRGGAAVGAGISIGFFLIYWLCLVAGEKLADRGLVSPWLSMWAPNLVLGGIGAIVASTQWSRRFLRSSGAAA